MHVGDAQKLSDIMDKYSLHTVLEVMSAKRFMDSSDCSTKAEGLSCMRDNEILRKAAKDVQGS